MVIEGSSRTQGETMQGTLLLAILIVRYRTQSVPRESVDSGQADPEG